ncbi:hypothetical protein DUI87_17670 [Hirundo rustica rustica]|uniref:Uncharacterized protein n=1 Tax=Hirundo rustica rustica TaxID=333673 RepID=A0A3M0JXP7_HIRRU|nr:hypothetical protein DUI87_17670 [Hirundo rustica rustica]
MGASQPENEILRVVDQNSWKNLDLLRGVLTIPDDDELFPLDWPGTLFLGIYRKEGPIRGCQVDSFGELQPKRFLLGRCYKNMFGQSHFLLSCHWLPVGMQLGSRTQSTAELITEVDALEGYKPWQVKADLKIEEIKVYVYMFVCKTV